MLHVIFQRQGISPDEVYAKPVGVQQYMFASTILALEEEERERKKLKQ
ncbi:hypothetical protein [Marinicrinis sediminis]|uniref:Uncharacterized protein n=1 Tax=Marinicrinis sediminis TaxID=1652465 RepID=A0ABW5R8W4_9BACL